jgi:TolB-like protein/DNA-binding winged helix-turn-helix (wHTH) protein/Tfp pilus assembly protein PilF
MIDSTRIARQGTAVPSLPDHFCLEDLRIDLGQQRVQRDAIDIPLPKLSFDALLALARCAPRLISVDDLMSQVWPGLVVNPETVAQRIKLLRDSLGDDPRNPRYIASLRGRGYRLLPAVVPVVAPKPVVAAEAILPPPQFDCEPTSVVLTTTELATKPPVSGLWSRRMLFMAIACIFAVGATALLWHLRRSARQGVADLASDSQVTVTGLPSRTVAVLPFDDLSIKHDNGQLALALPEMVLQRLGSIKELIVIARSSSFVFIGRQVDAREIGRRLNARYLVEGALQRTEDHLRVTAQLVDAQTGEQVRSLKFDRQLRDIFDLQDDIAGQLATALRVQLLGADLNRVDRSKITSFDAYLSYLDAEALLNRWTVADAERGAAELEHAVKIDPTFALGYAELARARWLVHFLSSTADPDGAEILPLANKALSLDPRLGEAYAIRGQLTIQRDPKAAEADFRRGIELAPNYGPGYEMYAEALRDNLERPEEGLAMIERAIQIDPVAPRNLYIKGLYLWSDKHQDEAAEQYFVQALAVGPEFPPAIARLATLRWEKGEIAESIKLIERALRVESRATWIRDLACAMYLDVGDRQAAGNVAVGVPQKSASTVMLAAYDRHFRSAVGLRGEWIERFSAARYAYYISVYAVAEQAGFADDKIPVLRKTLSLNEGLQNVVLPDNVDISGVFELGRLLSKRSDRSEFVRLIGALKAWADRMEDHSGIMHAEVQALAGERNAAIESLTADLRKEHSSEWWVRERDPILAPLRNDPRFIALLDVEHERVANQRKLLEQLRQQGDVPRRLVGSASPPGD